MTAASSAAIAEEDADLRLSPAPNALPLAVGSVASGVVFLFLVAVVGGSLQSLGLLATAITVGGLVLGGVCLYLALLSLQRALRSRSEQREGRILEARATAASARERALVAIGLEVALLIILGAFVLVLMNDQSVAKTFLRWELMVESAGDVVAAFGVNIFIAVIAEIFVLILGLMLAIARMLPGKSGRPIRALAIAYIDIMRAIPAVIVLYLVGFGLPLAGVPFLSGLSPVWYAIVALTLTYAAYTAEMIRAGIEQIHPSQAAASRSLGFSYAQTLRFVILPQALRAVVPPLLGTFIALQKDTSLVNIIGTIDAFNQAKIYASSAFNLSSVTVVAILFVIITIPQTRLVDWMLERGKKVRQR